MHDREVGTSPQTSVTISSFRSRYVKGHQLMEKLFSNKTALIVGGGSGIGLATAGILLRRGAVRVCSWVETPTNLTRRKRSCPATEPWTSWPPISAARQALRRLTLTSRPTCRDWTFWSIARGFSSRRHFSITRWKTTINTST